LKSKIDTSRTADINFLQPLSAQAQQARKIDISSAVVFLGCFDNSVAKRFFSRI